MSTSKIANAVPNHQMVPEDLMKEAVDEEGWKTVESKKGKGNANLRTKGTEIGIGGNDNTAKHSKQGRVQQGYKAKEGQNIVVVTHNTMKGNEAMNVVAVDNPRVIV